MNKKRYLSAFCILLLFGCGKEPSLPEDTGIAETELAFPVLNDEETTGTEEQDLILASYGDEAFHEETLLFFQEMTGSREVAEAILSNASYYNVAPALAFSLCAEESGYNPRALHRNKNETVDRGLFQLNSASFPKLKVEDFYDTAVNAGYGISHLRWCLNTAGTEIAALAMYNAGETRVRSVGTPKSTLDYVSRILNRQRKIEDRFEDYYCRIVDERNASNNLELVKQEEKVFFRFSLLTPLGR